MTIRFGCGLSIAVAVPTHTLCLVDVHPGRARDVLGAARFTVDAHLAVETGADHFGNIMRRMTVPAGLAGIILDDFFDHWAAGIPRRPTRSSHQCRAFPGASCAISC